MKARVPQSWSDPEFLNLPCDTQCITPQLTAEGVSARLRQAHRKGASAVSGDRPPLLFVASVRTSASVHRRLGSHTGFALREGEARPFPSPCEHTSSIIAEWRTYCRIPLFQAEGSKLLGWKPDGGPQGGCQGSGATRGAPGRGQGCRDLVFLHQQWLWGSVCLQSSLRCILKICALYYMFVKPRKVFWSF